MTAISSNKEFLVKYCKIMVSKLDNSEDQERMNKWLEAVTNAECDDETSEMYLELILWALHTDRINVFPFKFAPPVDHGDINDAYNYAQEIVQFVPEGNEKEKCGEIKTFVTDDLKEYFAVQDVPDFGSQCFYAFSDNMPISSWNMPADTNSSFQDELRLEPEYWMALFSRPESTIMNDVSKTVHEEKAVDSEEEAAAEEKEVDQSEKSICPDLSKVEHILNNLSFGGMKPQDVRSLVDKDDRDCDRRKISVTNSFDDAIRGSEVQIDTFVLSVDYSKNKSAGLSNPSKKVGKKRKRTTKQKLTQFVPSPFSKENRRSYFCDDSSFDSLDQLVAYKDKRRMVLPNYGYEMNMNNGTYPNDSTIALYNNSMYGGCYSNTQEQDSSLIWDSLSLNKSTFPVKSKKHQTTKLAGTLKLPESRTLRHSTDHKCPKVDEENDRFKRNRNNLVVVSPASTFPRNQRSSNADKAQFHKSKDIAPTALQNTGCFQDESCIFEQKNRIDQISSNHRRYRQESNSPIRRNIPQPKFTKDNSSEIKMVRVPSYADSLYTSLRTERRLQFSGTHVEPQQHKPNISAETPLKPCLRKSSNESPPLDKLDIFQSCKPREVNCNRKL